VKEAEEACEIAAAKGDPEEKDRGAVENEDAETDFDDELAEVKLRWRQAAKEKVKTYVQLQVRPTNSSQDMMREMMVLNIPDKKIQKSKKLLYIAYEESTLLRRTRVRVHNTDMEAVEQCAIICGKQFTLNGKRRLIGENSSNLFNILSGVASEDPTDEKEEWCLPVATKREVLGDTRKESGGSCALSSAGIKQSVMDKEPVSWHGNSCLFWREICSSYHACSLVDLTPQNDNAALACIMAKIPYFAITNNETHMALLTERLQERVFQEFQNPDSPLYEPVCVADFDVAC